MATAHTRSVGESTNGESDNTGVFAPYSYENRLGPLLVEGNSADDVSGDTGVSSKGNSSFTPPGMITEVYTDKTSPNDPLLPPPQVTERSGQSSTVPKLNVVNYLNTATFLCNVMVFCFVGLWGLNGNLYTITGALSRYKTFASHETWTFYIWLPIFIAEAVYTILQMTPNHRDAKEVQGRTKHAFIFVNVGQIMWVLFLGFGSVGFSFLSMGVTFLSLVTILLDRDMINQDLQHNIEILENDDEQGLFYLPPKYFFFHFPFSLHFGWAYILLIWTFNVVLRSSDSHALEKELAITVVSSSTKLPIAIYCLFAFAEPDFIIPAVFMLTSFASVPGSTVTLFGSSYVLIYRYISTMHTCILFFLWLPCLLVRLYRRIITLPGTIEADRFP